MSQSIIYCYRKIQFYFKTLFLDFIRLLFLFKLLYNKIRLLVNFQAKIIMLC